MAIAAAGGGGQIGVLSAPGFADPGLVTAAVAALLDDKPADFAVMADFTPPADGSAPELSPLLRLGYAVVAESGEILPPGTWPTRPGRRVFASARLSIPPAAVQGATGALNEVLEALARINATGWSIQISDLAQAKGEQGPPGARLHRRDLGALAALPVAGATAAPVPGGGAREGTPPDGPGVLLAAVDFGFDFAHGDFLRPDGGTRLRCLWNQNGPGRAEAAVPGRFYERDEIDAALRAPDPYAALGYHPKDAPYVPSTGLGDTAVHGTHVMGVAGGGRASGAPGAAPDGDLAFVHLRPSALVSDGDAADVFDGVCWVFERAAGFGAAAVVNLSVGANSGSHDGATLLDRAFDALLLKPGRAIVVAAGNGREKRQHASGVLRPDAPKRTLRWSFGSSDPTANVLRVFCDAPGGAVPLRCRVLRPDGLGLPEIRVGGASVLQDGRNPVAGIVYTGLAPALPGRPPLQHIEVRLPPSSRADQTWQIELSLAENVAGEVRFDAWIERDDRGLGSQSAFSQDDADPACSLGSVACGGRTICVGAYDANAPGHPVAAFSAEGQTRDRRNKPDVSAPGVRVQAAFALGGRPTVPGGPWVNPDVGMLDGTSVAAPHVAGVAALMLRARPSLTCEEVAAALRATTRVAEPTRETPAAEGGAPPRSWDPRLGYGRVDAAAAVRAVLPP